MLLSLRKKRPNLPHFCDPPGTSEYFQRGQLPKMTYFDQESARSPGKNASLRNGSYFMHARAEGRGSHAISQALSFLALVSLFKFLG